MEKLYTRAGDKGKTKNFTGKIMGKDSQLMECIGRVDELQSAIDLVMLSDMKNKEFLAEIQKKLWQVNGELADCPGDCLIWPVKQEDIEILEKFTDSLGEPPKGFVRFNSEMKVKYNECRVRTRALERQLVVYSKSEKVRQEILSYVNRLSSVFFMLAYTSEN
tara:strand:- start:1104 stop:1592 length:489 start_codon:yes stop_codon:yes gene_type:complete